MKAYANTLVFLALTGCVAAPYPQAYTQPYALYAAPYPVYPDGPAYDYYPYTYYYGHYGEYPAHRDLHRHYNWGYMTTIMPTDMTTGVTI